MTPTPGHGTKTDKERAHMFECWDEEGGPGWQLRQQVDKLRLWVAGASVLGIIASIAGPVVLAWWLSTRLPAPPAPRAGDSPALIKTAHAETKGIP